MNGRSVQGGSVAPLVERLAVLLGAGVPPAAAWSYLGDATENETDSGVVRVVAAALEAGSPGAPALVAAAEDSAGGAVPLDEWRQVAAAWAVAEAAGAPLTSCLTAFAVACRSLAQARRDAAVALSGPIMTARIVLALPLIGVLLGLAMGLDTLGVLLARPIGWFCLVAAGTLVVLARAWNTRLVARASPSSAVPGLELELLTVALGGGGSWPAARDLVRSTVAELCPAASDPGSEGEIDVLAGLSEKAGIPATLLLRSAADDQRRDARSAAAGAAERLGVLLMLPLGACILPAFVLVGVVPLFVALLSSTGITS